MFHEAIHWTKIYVESVSYLCMWNVTLYFTGIKVETVLHFI